MEIRLAYRVTKCFCDIEAQGPLFCARTKMARLRLKRMESTFGIGLTAAASWENGHPKR
jgi:hypothetical protein